MADKGSFSVVGIEEEPNIALSPATQGTIDSQLSGVMGQTPSTSSSNTQAQVEELKGYETPTVKEETSGLNLGQTVTAPLQSTWETTAGKMSEAQFQQNINAAKQTSFRSAAELQEQGQQMQTQLALGEYKRAQSAEKAGWTGGYMLDQKRQGDYLKAMIQAQMYGQQELQRYGMDTQLEAARLAYDLGKEQLSYQLYQEAQQKAIVEAQMFGYYVSPEIKDMMNQYTAAVSSLADNPNDERAQSIKSVLEGWFSKENIDPSDLATFGRITMEREQWNQAKLDAILSTINDDPSVFLARNTNGTYQTDPATGQYIKLNFEDISSTDLLNFLKQDDGSDNKFADSAFRSYAKYLAQFSINGYFSSLSEGQEPTNEGFAAYLATQGNDKLATYIAGLDRFAQPVVSEIIKDNFNPSLTRGGKTISYRGVGPQGTGGGATTTPETPTVSETEPQTILTDYVNPITEKEMTWESFTEKYNSYFSATNPLFSSNTLNANDLANLYKEDYAFYNDVKNGSSSNLDYDAWSKRLHRTHNTFSDKNYGTYLDETIKSVIKNKTGIDNLSIKFEDQQTRISVPASSVTKDTESKLLKMGFVLSQGSYVLSAKGGIPNVSGYTIFSGWNDKYRYESANQKQYLLYNLIKNINT
jgi:hypothetical protein